jgi:hypothetical protein
MNQNQLKTVIREFLSSDKGSPVIGSKYENQFLEKRQEYINALLKNKKSLVKRYGKDAEKVLTGRAVKDAKKYIDNMKQQDIKELVRKSLMKEDDNDLLSQLEAALKSHDWYYMMSDDNRAYQKGSQEVANIKNLVSKTGDEGMALYNKYKELKFKLEEETIDSKKYISEREENPEDKITMDVPLFIRMLEYAREDASTDVDLHDVAEKAIGLSGEDKVLTMADYDAIVGETESINEDDWMQKDDESDMADSQLKSIQSNASKLMNMIDNDEQLDAWVQAKLTKSQDYLQSVNDYLTGEEGETEELAEERFKKGTDIGKKGPGFEKVAKKAGKAYGSEEAGKRVAGAVLQKILAKKGK